MRSRQFRLLAWVLAASLLLAELPAAQELPEPEAVQFFLDRIAVSEGVHSVRLWVVGGEYPSDPLFFYVTQVADVPDSAERGKDYYGLDRGVMLQAGGRELIEVGIIDDDEQEGPEEFSVLLHDPSSGTTLGEPSVLTIQILDDDSIPPGGAIGFLTSFSTWPESGGSATVEVGRFFGASGEVTAECVYMGGYSNPGVHYRFAPVVLTWPDGDVGTRTVTVELLDDGVPTLPYEFVLGFRSVSGATLSGTGETRIRVEDTTYVPPEDPAPVPDEWDFNNIGPAGWCFIEACR